MRKNYGPVYAMPAALWISVFFVVPISIIFLYSFLEKGLYGGVVWKFSLDAYCALSNPTFLQVAIITIILSIAATIITLLLALPTAYFIARSAYKNSLLFLVIIPFWTNFLIRIYAWIAILGNNQPGVDQAELVAVGQQAQGDGQCPAAVRGIERRRCALGHDRRAATCRP